MASKRRGGFRPPELRGTLGTLFRTTTGVVRDALERGAREGRARLDGARATFDSARASLDSRRPSSADDGARDRDHDHDRRHNALADLGELLLDLIRRGEVDLAELPEARDLVRELDQLDDDTTAADLDAEPDLPRAASRHRFDDRSPDDNRRLAAPSLDSRRPADRAARNSSLAGSTAAAGSAGAGAARTRARRDSDDGTVSSGATLRPDRPARAERPDRPTRAERPDRPTRAERPDRPTVPDRSHNAESSSSRAPTKPIKSIWRPLIDDPPTAPNARDPAAAAAAAPRDHLDHDSGRHARPDRDTERDTERDAANHDADHAPSDRGDRRPTLPRDPTRKGGISFDDEDLADYMHPDDVPAKPGPKDPGDHEA